MAYQLGFYRDSQAQYQLSKSLQLKRAGTFPQRTGDMLPYTRSHKQRNRFVMKFEYVVVDAEEEDFGAGMTVRSLITRKTTGK